MVVDALFFEKVEQMQNYKRMREKRTGVVLAKSIPAKKFGVKTGEPIGSALRKCPDLFWAKPDFRLYEEMSKAFIKNERKNLGIIFRG